jgi:hypothetical protein
MAKYKISPKTLSYKIRHFEGLTDKESCVDVLAGASPDAEDYTKVKNKYE